MTDARPEEPKNEFTNERTNDRSWPLGTAFLCAVALVFYVVMLANVRFSAGGGDAVLGEAIAELMFTFLLWVALAALFVAGAVMGEMPRWPKFAAIVLVPLAGVTTFTAIDMCSRHMKWAIVFPVVLPLLVALYALWARFPACHAALPPRPTSLAAFGLSFGLSVIALIAAAA